MLTFVYILTISLDNIVSALGSSFPKAIEAKNNGYVVTIPFEFYPDCKITDDAINDYNDIINKCRACVEFTKGPAIYEIGRAHV